MGRIIGGLMCVLALAAGTARADVDYWRRVGGIGIVRALAVDPTNASIIYAAHSNAGTHLEDFGNELAQGIRKSTNGGATWTEMNLGLGSLRTTSIAIDPTNTSIVYVGTSGGGVYRSTNGGASWSPRSTGLSNLEVYAVAVDPTTPTTLYAGHKQGGVSRSIDGGATWTPGTGIAGLTVWQIAIDPVTPSKLYAASNAGVRRSTNGGVSWGSSGIMTRPATPTLEAESVFDVRTVAVDASNPSTILAGLWEGAGVFKSTNGGTSWTHVGTGLRSAFGNWRFVNVIVQDPVDPTVFYLSATTHSFRSIDGGDTWAVFDAGLSRGEAFGLTTQSSVGGVWIASVFGEVHTLDTKTTNAEHFRCFPASGKGFTVQSVQVSDKYATDQPHTLLKPYRFCTPTSLSGEPIADAATQLVCYKVRAIPFEPTFEPFLTQRVDGYRGYDLLKPETVCVPASIGGGPPANPRDAYRCIRGRRFSNDTLDVTLADDFGSHEVRQTKNDRVCYPAEIDGDPVLDDDVYLRCDKLLGSRPTPTSSTVTIEDRFGIRTLKLKKPDSHCFPALESRDG